MTPARISESALPLYTRAMKAPTRTALSVLALALCVAACGNKGDLVLPTPEATPPEPAKDASASQENVSDR